METFKNDNYSDEIINLLKGIRINKTIYTNKKHPLILYLIGGGKNNSIINDFIQIQNDSLNNFEYNEKTHPLFLYKNSGGNDENTICMLGRINQKKLKEIESKMTRKYLKYKTKYFALRNTKNKNTHL